MKNKNIVIPDLPELTFDEDTHTYRLNGSVIPSVTQIMKPMSAQKYGNVSEHILQAAASKGTIVHAGIESWLKFGIEDVPDEFYGYFQAFKDWWKFRHPELIASEVKIYHVLMRYAGTIDLLVVIDGLLTLIDIKTTYNLEKKMCATQLEAYSQALASHGINVEAKRILHLKKDGQWEDPEFAIKDAKRLVVFNALKTVHDDLND